MNGHEALAEAMRLEMARIYGQVQREHHNRPAEPEHAALDRERLAAERCTVIPIRRKDIA